MSSPKTSKPDSSATKSQPLPAFDKLYWLRLGVAAVAGLFAELEAVAVGAPDWGTGLAIGVAAYLVSYYLARFTWYRSAERAVQAKVYTTGIGGFVLVFLFTWMIFFTLQTVGYPV